MFKYFSKEWGVIKTEHNTLGRNLNDSFIPSRKYQMKPEYSPWLTPTCLSAIAQRNYFLRGKPAY